MIAGNQGRLSAAAILLGTAALYVLGPRVLDRAALPIAGVEARTTGLFTRSGDLPISRGFGPDGARKDGEPGDGNPAAGGPFWSSWNGSNAGKGTLELGPFPAPSVLGLPGCGYPRVKGNRLYLENTMTTERIEVTEGNIGAAWTDIRLRLPRSWLNQPVVLHAVDDSTGYYGWLAVGAPRDVAAYAAWWTPFARKLRVFLGAGLVLLLLQATAMRLLRNRPEIPVPLLPLASFALVSLAGYAVFWLFCASPLAGKGASWAIVAVSAWSWIFRGPRNLPLPRGPLLLMAAAGMFYFGLLTLYGSERSLSDLAAHRYINDLVFDNELPHMFADRLIQGEDSRHLLFGWWLSTDRPPLQTGCDLLLAYPLASMGGFFETAAQAVGIWVQLFWVCAAYGWLRTVGASSRTTAIIVAALVPVGFFVLNTVFVWPKLIAAAFLLGAFTIWSAAPRNRPEGASRPIAWGTLAALSFLAHPGSAFSMLAWAPFALARTRRRFSAWVPAAAAFAVLVIPWMAYQHFYNPPGNTLVKRHLAGVEDHDQRSTLDALVDAYRSHDAATLLHYRQADLGTVFGGPWLNGLTFRGTDLAGKRNAEFLGLFYALGWWNLGFAAMGALALSAWRGRAGRGQDSMLLLSVGWCLLTLVIWVAMMFSPGSTIIQSGSYTCVLLLFLCLAWALWRVSPFAFGLAAVGNLVNFGLVWILPNPSRIGPLHWASAVVAVLAAFAMIIAAAAASPGDSCVTATAPPAAN